MRPGVTRLKFQPLTEAAFQRQTQSVVRAGPDVSLDVNRAERVWIVRIGIELVEVAHAVAIGWVEDCGGVTEIDTTAREQVHSTAANILRRGQEVRGKFMFRSQPPGFDVQVPTPV